MCRLNLWKMELFKYMKVGQHGYFFVAKFFGSGVIVATAFIHLSDLHHQRPTSSGTHIGDGIV